MLREDLAESRDIPGRGRTPPDAADITALFQRFDLDGDGTISRAELTDVLKMLDPVSWDDSNLSTVFNELYPDGRGSLDYCEFVSWIMAGSSTAAAVLDKSIAATPVTSAETSTAPHGARRRRRGSSPASHSARGRKRSPTAERSTGRHRPSDASSPAHRNSSSRNSTPHIEARQASGSPAPASKFGSRIAKRVCLTCRKNFPADGADGWMRLTLGRGTDATVVNRSELSEHFGEATEWQLLEAVQPLTNEQSFDVSVGRPLRDMLPPSQMAREEGWVTCSWIEPPASRELPGSHKAESSDAIEEVAGTELGADGLGITTGRETPAVATGTEEAPAEAMPLDGEVEEKVFDEVSQLQVKVVTQMQEMNEKGLMRIFSQTSMAPDVCQVWWRVGPRSSEGFRPDELLDVVIQSLDIDETGIDSSEVPMSREPPSFLKPHQRKSVCWMSAREHSTDPFIADWHSVCPLSWQFSDSLSKAPARWAAGTESEAPKTSGPSRVSLGDGPIALQLDYRMENVYTIHGGVLADPVGSGKTATCLSHIACTHGTPMPASGNWQRQYLVPLDATLVLCPENVHHQWLAEIHKWPELEEVIDAVPIHNVASLVKAGLRSSTKKKARVVVAPYSVFNDAEYKAKLLSPISSTPEDWKRKIGNLQFQARSGEPCKGLALESYNWRRVILDEFHELAGTSEELQVTRKILRFLQSSMRWGVTGTPEELLRSTGTARRAAKIFQCELNARRSAQSFCEQFYRSSRVELDVPVQQRVVPVSHMGSEAAIYMQYIRDVNLVLGSRPWNDADVAKLRQLLQFCSHFTAEEAPVAMKTAESSTEAAMALHLHKGRAVTKALLDVESQTKYWEESCMEFEDERLRAAREFAFSAGKGGRRRFDPSCKACSKLRNLCANCEKAALLKTCRALEFAHHKATDALKSLNFFDAVWQLATRSNEEEHCVICLEDYQIKDGGLLHCAHMFCFNCINMALKAGRRACPLCRAPMDPSKVVPVGQLRRELQKKEEEESDDLTPEAEVDYGDTCRKYGSKLQAIVWALAEVKKADPEAKVILFSQWQNLETKIADALSEFRISHLRLSTCTDIFERRRVLESFQDPSNREARVLLLSLDGHASGTNLTCASHVFLVHPMLAATAEQQAAYERQAIGRAARLGQRKTVTVWRFLTRGTVEEEVARSM